MMTLFKKEWKLVIMPVPLLFLLLEEFPIHTPLVYIILK